MLDLIILVLISLILFDSIYFEFLEEQNLKQIEKKKQIEKVVLETLISISVEEMIQIEQKLRMYKKIINNKEASSYEIWLAEGSRIKLKEEWIEKYDYNKMLIGIKN